MVTEPFCPASFGDATDCSSRGKTWLHVPACGVPPASVVAEAIAYQILWSTTSRAAEDHPPGLTSGKSKYVSLQATPHT